MKTLIELEKEIEGLKKRNEQVDSNKAWEISWTRKILIIIFTYLSISLYLQFIVHIDPWINAVVPALGFTLSTLTLPWFKKMWKKHIYKT